MKQVTINICLLFCLLLVPAIAVASHTGTHYGKAVAYTTGNGKVYVSTTLLEEDQTPTKWSGSESDNFSETAINKCVGDGGSVTEDDKRDAYYYAQAEDGFYFSGWKERKGDATVKSADNPYATEFTLGSTDKENPSEYNLYAFFNELPLVTVTMVSSNHGSYTYTSAEKNGSVSSEAPVSIETKYPITLEVKPDDGYEFYAWFLTDKSGNKQRVSVDVNYKKSFLEDATLEAVFVPIGAPVFLIKGTGQYYTDLNGACEAAKASESKTVVVDKDGSLTEGTYTIPSGITLLIPFDKINTVYTTQEGNTVYPGTMSGWKVYRKLTLANGVNIVVNGDLCVGGKLCPADGGTHPCVVGARYGQIDMQENSHITMNNGSNLYAWGYITGKGEVLAKSGAIVHEDFQLPNFRGGSMTSTMYSNRTTYKVFPFSQYYVQNIETLLKFEYGAKELVYIAIYAGSTITDAKTIFIGNYNDDVTKGEGLFRMRPNSSLTKQYDVENDRLLLTAYGDADIESLTLTVSTIELNTTDFALPINSNMSIAVENGTLRLNNEASLLPDAELIIKKDATLHLTDNGVLNVYDKDQWTAEYKGNQKGFATGTNDYLASLWYSPSKPDIKTYRTYEKMKDASIDIQGTIISEGAVYTTTSGAQVYSSTGTGTFVWKNAVAAVDPKTYQAFQNGTSPVWKDIPVTPAQLYNADGSYTLTTGSLADTTYYYVYDKWVLKDGCRYYAKMSDGDHYYIQLEDNQLVELIEDLDKSYFYFDPTEKHTILNTEDCNCVEVNPNKETIGDIGYYPSLTGDVMYRYNDNKGYWEKCIKVTWRKSDSDEDPLVEIIDYEARPIYTAEAPITYTDESGRIYEWKGWANKVADAEKVYTIKESLPAATTNVIYTAVYEVVYGNPLDVVDVTENGLVVNMNNYPIKNWTLSVDGGYTLNPDNTNSDSTVTIPFGTLKPDEKLIIDVLADNEVKNHNLYTIPHVITTDTTLSAVDLQNYSAIFVQGGVLTLQGDIVVKNLTVAPCAELVIDGGTLTTDKLVLRTSPSAASILTNNGTVNGQVYYSRIVNNAERGKLLQIGLPYSVAFDQITFSNGHTEKYGTKFVLMEYDADRRDTVGPDGANWKVTEDTKMIASKSYKLLSALKNYNELYFPVTLDKPTSVEVAVKTQTLGKNEKNQGWNFLCSPATGRLNISGSADATDLLQIHVYVEPTGDKPAYYDQRIVTKYLQPAMPFFYRTLTNGSLVFNFTEGMVTQPAVPVQSAPRRLVAADVPTQLLQINYGNASSDIDQTNIYLHPTKFTTTYQPRYDGDKLSTSGAHPFVWTSMPYGNMAFAALPDSVATEQGIALTVFAPVEQTMTISLSDNRWLTRMEHVYLLDKQEQKLVDLLQNDYTYDATAGTSAGRFVIYPMFYAPGMIDGIETPEAASFVVVATNHEIWVNQVENGTLVVCYDMMGHLVYKGLATADVQIIPVPASGLYFVQAMGMVQKVVVR